MKLFANNFMYQDRVSCQRDVWAAVYIYVSFLVDCRLYFCIVLIDRLNFYIFQIYTYFCETLSNILRNKQWEPFDLVLTLSNKLCVQQQHYAERLNYLKHIFIFFPSSYEDFNSLTIIIKVALSYNSLDNSQFYK